MPTYRYRPETNRTPVHHHLYGALEWDKLIEWPEPIVDPNFEEVKETEPEDKAPAVKAPARPANEPQDEKSADTASADGS